ncbi:DUF6710 family protein [Hutsoniella sourekii]|uniref:DUF6710 family protein n=1 Tax=Hutsoniella sourekii TaxID=87650 RepID=UPI000484F428|nr:DUF6710 family protein [Hutsoniella sourekii]
MSPIKKYLKSMIEEVITERSEFMHSKSLNDLARDKQRQIYIDAMESLNDTLNAPYALKEGETRTQALVNAVDFLCQLVRRDVVTSFNASNIIYRERLFFDSLPFFPINQSEQADFQMVSIEKDLIAIPWNYQRTLNISNLLKEQRFSCHPTNHRLFYFVELDLLVALNGLHSLAYSHTTKKKGVVSAEIMEFEPGFHKIFTDGLYWYDSESKKKITNTLAKEEVIDVRLAILFSYCQKLDELKRKLRNEERDKEEQTTPQDKSPYWILIDSFLTMQGFTLEKICHQLEWDYEDVKNIRQKNLDLSFDQTCQIAKFLGIPLTGLSAYH